jgi:hypothetical protein
LNKRVLTGIVSAAALLAVVSLLAQAPAPTTGQNKGKGGAGAAKGGGGLGLFRNQAAPPSGTAPKLADGTPDLSGVWLGGGGSDADIAKSQEP